MGKLLAGLMTVVISDLAAKAIIKYSGVLDKTNKEIDEELDKLNK